MKRHQLALWSGVSALLSSLLLIGVYDASNSGPLVAYIGTLLVALITAGSIYAKQRYEDAREEAGQDETKGR